MRKRSVVLLSGGLDSAANLAFCKDRDEPVLALTVRYGQKAEKKEVEAAQKLARYYSVPHETVDLPWLGALGGSSLTHGATTIPKMTLDQLNDPSVTQQTAKSVWVPNRNGVLIHVGAAYAERMLAERVIVGFNREEAATFPDNSTEYLNRVTHALELSTANAVKVYCYTSEMNKTEIVQELETMPGLSFPLALVWSCYEGGQQPCWNCESCRRFSRATGQISEK